MRRVIKKERFSESGLSAVMYTAGYTKIKPELLMSADARNVCARFL